MRRVLIANRGEIAVRIARGCHLLDLEAVAVYSEADATARHVRFADLAVCIGPAEPAQSYLDGARILEAARRTGADAIHPGYGFLSESPDFARAVEAAGLIWIGPPADVIAPLASKTAAKAVASQAGVPTAPSVVLELAMDAAALTKAAAQVGYPLLVKPQEGGGGKGMERVDGPDQLEAAVAASRRVALSAFASDKLFLERYVERARHVEVQVLGDHHGEVIHLFERECSLQRRHQKVVEESPCADLSAAEREAICESGRAFAARIGYVGAGTVEFLFDPVSRAHYFLEMNTRLQVEHPVSEVVVGIDLVAAQLRIARGERIADMAALAAPSQRGHAVELRIYAEDPAAGFVPTAGPILRASWPAGPFVRVDSGYETGDEVSMYYDPMIAKIIVWGSDRPQALERARVALGETIIHGVRTNVAMLLDLIARDDVRAGAVHTHLIDAIYADGAPGLIDTLEPAALAVLAAAGPGGPMHTHNAASGGAVDAGEQGESLRDPWLALTGLRVGADGGGES